MENVPGEASLKLDLEARKILRKWAKMECYVYLRPLSSLLIERKKPFRVHWRVAVEMRSPWRQWAADGYNVSAVIKQIDEDMASGKKPGAAMPLREGTVKVKRKETLAERPRRRPESKKKVKK